MGPTVIVIVTPGVEVRAAYEDGMIHAAEAIKENGGPMMASGDVKDTPHTR